MTGLTGHTSTDRLAEQGTKRKQRKGGVAYGGPTRKKELIMNTLRNTLIASLLVAGSILSVPASASVSIGMDIRVPGVSIDLYGAPPPPRFEAWPGARRGYVWHPGYWRWEGRNYVWVGGRWARERPGYVWVPERWERHGRDWVFVAGRWNSDRNWREAQHRERNRWESWRRDDMRREAEWRREHQRRVERREERREDRREERREFRQDHRPNPGWGNGGQPPGRDRHDDRGNGHGHGHGR